MQTLSQPTMESVASITRPEKNLLIYYVILSFVLGPAFAVALLPLYFRFHTLRYRFDEEGIHMKWGILFRREINLTYGRIQDIHLVSNVVERWLGLARIQIQTASGSSKPEMTIEGIHQYELLRDFLYLKMRGAKGLPSGFAAGAAQAPPAGRELTEAVAALREASQELKIIRESLSNGGGLGKKG